MRTAFIETLLENARRNENIWLLVGDLGYSVVEPFIREFPDRFVNTGVAEQNMIGVATGLAVSGKTVFVYSIANFPTLRCYEQIRNDVCYHNANVKIVAVGGGLVYGTSGMTHHAIEDIAVMRVLPNMTVMAPGDPIEASLATKAIIEHQGPCYLRLGKNNEPIIHTKIPPFEIGKSIKLRDGRDVTLISTGGMLQNSIQAAELLDTQGISTRIISMHTVKPLDNEAILSAAKETNYIFTIEEHSIIGGLGSAVSETLLESPDTPVYFKRLGLKDTYSTRIGSQEFLKDINGLSPEGIKSTVMDFVRST
ncbi:MAG: transketolase [Dehalococcoidales bacterium]|nr:transketolase [Dehalococcoidales bacterium]